MIKQRKRLRAPVLLKDRNEYKDTHGTREKSHQIYRKRQVGGGAGGEEHGNEVPGFVSTHFLTTLQQSSRLM